MAFWQRRPSGQVRVFEWKDGKQITVPRARIQHLDGQPDEVIDVFVRSLSQPKVAQSVTPELEKLLEQYSTFLLVRRGRNAGTVGWVRWALTRHVFPFFLEYDPPLKNPLQWPGASVRMLDWLEARGLSADGVIRCNAALSGLWKWMGEEGMVPAGIGMLVRRPIYLAKMTPLQYSLTPDRVLEFMMHADAELRFMALCGFFFSLRTQETLALTKADFRAGERATELECCKVMGRADLFGRLALNVTKQKQKSGSAGAPKKGSRGWVACFDATAARHIVALVRRLDDTAQGGTLVRFSVDYNLHRWAKDGIPNITLKDLRRASLYWLGHYSKLDLVALRSHARHSLIQTTALYLRRPEEHVAPQDDLDLDA